MILLDRNNQEVEVLSQFALPNHTETVYNFEVDDFHTYHIGEYGVWCIMRIVVGYCKKEVIKLMAIHQKN
ncbi:hypothetical protein AO369_1054 [Moraxella catarrhalis]|nr:hypothetical protein AO369_1054 [Moraxella catarrhalis]